MTRRDEESGIGARTASRKRKRSAETKEEKQKEKKQKRKFRNVWVFHTKNVSKFMFVWFSHTNCILRIHGLLLDLSDRAVDEDDIIAFPMNFSFF